MKELIETRADPVRRGGGTCSAASPYVASVECLLSPNCWTRLRLVTRGPRLTCCRWSTTGCGNSQRQPNIASQGRQDRHVSSHLPPGSRRIRFSISVTLETKTHFWETNRGVPGNESGGLRKRIGPVLEMNRSSKQCRSHSAPVAVSTYWGGLERGSSCIGFLFGLGKKGLPCLE